MKAIRRCTHRKLPPLRIYEDELRELYSFLTDTCEESISIETCGYELDSIDECRNLPEKQSHEITISCKKPYLQIQLTQHYGEMYCGDANIEAEGIISRAEQILRKGERNHPRLTEKWWWLIPLFAGLLGMGCASQSVSLIAVGTVLLVLSWVVVVVEYRLSYNTVVFALRKDAPSFWSRNKDQVLLLFIGAVVGSLFTIVVSLTQSLFTNKP